ncbi:MAG: EF-P lysine aminoacylase GenX, partial [Methylobacteriaceae bacterium]|nr:EF-P lysine aminoacylase GenX [Methylobacteriaceae bacterium]
MSQWWARDRHAARRPFLLARARITAALRGWFAAEGFVEVEPDCLQVSPGNETHLHGVSAGVTGLDGVRRALWLHTSPEFAMKKLLAAGEEKIFALAPVFRAREGSALHTVEFTMLEWYRAGAPYTRLMQDCSAILRLAAGAGPAREAEWR